jgi:tetratricopeptide (TPR) repeat protein
MASTYTLREAGTIVGIPLSAIRGFINNGFVSPSRGTRREYRFDFRDLVVLRMARGLADASLSQRRIAASLKRLRKQLPEQLPLTGLRIAAVGSDVVVFDGPSRWRADDGQYLLAFEVSESTGDLAFAPAPTAQELADWFAHAFSLEEADPSSSMASYQKAIDDDPCLAGAYANLGRLLHQAGRVADAETVYRAGANACAADPILFFNFAVLKEDQGSREEAIKLYKQALATDPDMADAHCNLGLLYESLGREREALRHFSAYRKLNAESDSTGR